MRRFVGMHLGEDICGEWRFFSETRRAIHALMFLLSPAAPSTWAGDRRCRATWHVAQTAIPHPGWTPERAGRAAWEPLCAVCPAESLCGNQAPLFVFSMNASRIGRAPPEQSKLTETPKDNSPLSYRSARPPSLWRHLLFLFSRWLGVCGKPNPEDCWASEHGVHPKLCFPSVFRPSWPGTQ